MPGLESWIRLERLSLKRTKAADTLVRIGSFDSAVDAYTAIIQHILRTAASQVEHPSISDAQRAELMACYVGLAKCAEMKGNTLEALLHLDEVQALYLTMRWASKPHLYEWTRWFPDDMSMAIQYSRARVAESDIFLGVMNTGSAVHRRYELLKCLPKSITSKEPAFKQDILPLGALNVLFQFRHPDPLCIADQKLVDPQLQVLGSWKKLKIAKSSTGPGRRMSFSGFVWDGHLYIAGGRKDSLGPFYRDIWSLDLSKFDGWKALPDYPKPMSQTSAFLGWLMLPHVEHKKAYLFTGRPTLDFFDLETKTWGSISTQFQHSGQADTIAGIKPGLNSWPYPKNQLTDSTQQLLGDKLYVFGGTHGTTSIGCNLFLVLDLKTRSWKRLSGTVMPTQDDDPREPGPRKTPCSWADPIGGRFYLLFGECDRMGAAYSGEIHGADHGYAFNDFWSWHPDETFWRRERWLGNVPGARSESACVYNPKINKTIVWGGYNPDLPTVFHDHGVTFAFSYFADTFIYDGTPNTNDGVLNQHNFRSWRQVITSSFPTYRAQSMMFADPVSGRTFLYGGFSNNDYVPSRVSAISRSFGDVWELLIDIPNGGFTSADGHSKVDFEAERRSARVGPWQRCFACGCAGQWKKCGGSCNGRVFFCDEGCLKEGWKEHKAAHGCRKI